MMIRNQLIPLGETATWSPANIARKTSKCCSRTLEVGVQ